MYKINKYLLFLWVMLIVSSCGEIRQIVKKETPRDKYVKQLENAGLLQTEMGKQWMAAGDTALVKPVQVALPYKEKGFFFANAAHAHGYIFEAQRGEKIVVKMKQENTDLSVFLDLFVKPSPGSLDRIASAGEELIIEQESMGSSYYILRVQPELLNGGRFELSIELQPTLAFPVSGFHSGHIQSFWHAPRDGGKRKHEGIDVFAPRGTPVVAVSDGLVTRTGTNRLGGNVVFVRSSGKSIYYAHLDSHNVSSGTLVKKGDTLGFVGNTGNAEHTLPHLHFGIYTSGGAVDPLPFIKDKRPVAPVVRVPENLPGQWARTKNKTTLYSGAGTKFPPLSTLAALTPFTVLAGADKYLKIKLADNTEGYIAASSAELLKNIRTVATTPDKYLKLSPTPDSQVVYGFEDIISLTALAETNNHWLISFNDQYLWLEK